MNLSRSFTHSLKVIQDFLHEFFPHLTVFVCPDMASLAKRPEMVMSTLDRYVVLPHRPKVLVHTV